MTILRNILKVFKRDLKSIRKNPIALIIVIALSIIPCLYAWINIKACWDPYSNTSTIPVAIVNEDKGTTLFEKEINIGKEVVSSLEENTSIGWDFVTEKKGDMGLVDGTYFAMIIIPEDFSQNITSLLNDSPKKPEIIYKANSKATPVASKITEVAQGKIVGEITSNFISTVNKTVFEKLNLVGEKLEKNKNQVIELRKGIIYANKHLDQIIEALDNGSTTAGALNQYLVELKTVLPQMKDGIEKIEKTNDKTSNLISSVQITMNQTFDNMRIMLNDIDTEADKTHKLVEDINNGVSDGVSAEIAPTIMNIENTLDAMSNSVDAMISYLEKLNETANNEDIAKLISNLSSIKENINSEKDNLAKLEKALIETNKVNTDIANTLNDLSLEMSNETTEALRQYDNTSRPALNGIQNNLLRATKDASEVLKTSEGAQEQISNMLNLGIEGTGLASNTTKDLAVKLKEFKSIIGLMAEALEKTNEGDVIQIIGILQSKPELMGNFIASPINVKEEPVYGVPNYGSAMAPIYSVLALWVGALMLISILKVNPPKFQGDENITVRQKHFGKLMFFSTLGFAQGLIVSLGNILMLGVHSENPFLMVIMSSFIGIVFNIIVFTLMSVLGNIGKVISIVLMVIQLAGCGGTYPIQVDPLFFRILQPFFPFTYAVGGYREAIAGALPSAVALDFIVLGIYGGIFILIGFFFKEKLHNKIMHFEESFEESGVGE